MSKLLITQYYNQLDKVKQYGGSHNETSIRNSFFNLLNEYAHKKNLELIPELATMGTKGKKVRPDGVLKNALRLEYGLWESKDEKTNLDDEIEVKVRLGYSLKNILFEDSQTAVLYQNDFEVLRVNMKEPEKLDKILTDFVSFEKSEVREFNAALEHFKQDIPVIIETLRGKIEAANRENKKYAAARDIFLELCQKEINPDVTADDIREMIIQHILTADIFNVVFDEPHFHRENNIARELERLIDTFFTGASRRNALESINHYYKAINAAAASIADHHEKQKFLKVIYENFYKVYNPKAADRLGVVYTPNEIVTFMLESTDYLLHKHFGKTLADKNVEILDPATGTGTFITELIDQFIPKKDLAYKYANEIHCNEVSILPYYIANLNIEYTFKQKMGYYEEFKNICFVDTLDNTDGLTFGGKQHDLFGLSSENSERIKKQNSKKISVIIGNPPYNANQESENDNNKNREYFSDSLKKAGGIDGRIKETYIKHSNAQKTKQYDMYKRFFRWASDRLKDDGLIVFVTNRKFLEGSQDDGFRKCVREEFNEAYFLDLAGDLREDKEGNVFDIKVGVAVSFLIKKNEEKKVGIINYFRVPVSSKREKLEFLKTNKIGNLDFEKIIPDDKNNWLKLSYNDFSQLLPVANKATKHAKKPEDYCAIFKNFSLGLITARDEWVYDMTPSELSKKVEYLISTYNEEVKRLTIKEKMDAKSYINYSIKWTRAVKKDLLKGIKYKFNKDHVVESSYRPFVKRELYYDKHLNEMRNQLPYLFPTGKESNPIITLNNYTNRHSFSCLSVTNTFNYNFNGDPVESLPFYTYDENGNKKDNITDWGLKQFTDHYKDKKIKKEDIFNYTYGVLHNPAYRKKYELNLKREFPRLPFYKNFWQWAKWGKELMDLHINYEEVKPFKLELTNSEAIIKELKKPKQEKLSIAAEAKELYLPPPSKIKVRLKADKVLGEIELDEVSVLKGIPIEAWEYKLGNRSALEWVLDQYKEKKYSDPTIAEKFNTYRFSDYKEKVIDLLKRVTTVSVETMKIIKEMEKSGE